MAIKVNGTTVINDSRALTNIASVDATTVAALGAAGVGASGPDWNQLGSTVSYSPERGTYTSPNYTVTIPSNTSNILLEMQGDVKAISAPAHMQGIHFGLINSSSGNWNAGRTIRVRRYSSDTNWRFFKVWVKYDLTGGGTDTDAVDFSGPIYVGSNYPQIGTSTSSVQEFTLDSPIGTSSDSHNIVLGGTARHGFRFDGNTKVRNMHYKIWYNAGT